MRSQCLIFHQFQRKGIKTLPLRHASSHTAYMLSTSIHAGDCTLDATLPRFDSAAQCTIVMFRADSHYASITSQ